jgi:hypothetical protein
MEPSKPGRYTKRGFSRSLFDLNSVTAGGYPASKSGDENDTEEDFAFNWEDVWRRFDTTRSCLVAGGSVKAEVRDM